MPPERISKVLAAAGVASRRAADELVAAYSVNQVIVNIAAVVGAAVAGVLIAAVGLTACYALDAASFAVLALATSRMRPLPPSGDHAGVPLSHALVDGFRYIRDNPIAQAVYLVDLTAMVFGLPRALTLAVSLHAANDALRDQLVPLNRRYPLERLHAACRHWTEATGRRLSLEWALIDGVNDTPAAIDELADFARPLRAHVNLIPLNPTPGYPVRGSTPARVRAVRDQLEQLGVNATVRETRGRSIAAACGQLATVTRGRRRLAVRAGVPEGGAPARQQDRSQDAGQPA